MSRSGALAGKARQADSISVFYDHDVYYYLGTLATVNF